MLRLMNKGCVTTFARFRFSSRKHVAAVVLPTCTLLQLAGKHIVIRDLWSENVTLVPLLPLQTGTR